MSEATVLPRPADNWVPSGYLTFDRRWLYLTGACGLWAVAFWQLTGPLAWHLSEAGRVRMPLPYHFLWVNGLPWLAIAVVGTLACLATGPRLRQIGNAVLVGLPLVANLVIHLSL